MAKVVDQLDLRAGEFVEVRSKEEILGSLDEDGRLDGMPFMPEMLQFCGRRLTVASRADKSCMFNAGFSLRRLRNAVHLDTARCDGASHGGCGAACLIFWKEAWLKRATGVNPGRPSGHVPREGTCTEHHLELASRETTCADGDERFRCQATELARFSAPLHWWDIRHFARDARSGHLRDGHARLKTERLLESALTWLRVARAALVLAFNKIQSSRNCGSYPPVGGTLKKTPAARLTLAPGDIVKVKSKAEIVGTLDSNKCNRGMSFDAEMLPYCGGMFQVLKRVERIVDERSGKMLRLSNDCVVLDGVVCRGEYHGLCPRASYPYWREIWLEKVARPAGSQSADQRRQVEEPAILPEPLPAAVGE